MKFKLILGAAVITTAALAACGGGGSTLTPPRVNVSTSPSAMPSGVASGTPTASASPRPSGAPSASPTPLPPGMTPTPTPTPLPSGMTPGPTASPRPSTVPSASPSASALPSSVPTALPTASPGPTPTPVTTVTPTPAPIISPFLPGTPAPGVVYPTASPNVCTVLAPCTANAMDLNTNIGAFSGSPITAQVNFTDTGTTFTANGTGTGFTPGLQYVGIVYNFGSAATGAKACVPTNAALYFSQMVLGYWLPITGTSRTLIAVKTAQFTGSIADYVPLPLLGTTSVRLDSMPNSLYNINPSPSRYILQACGLITNRANNPVTVLGRRH